MSLLMRAWDLFHAIAGRVLYSFERRNPEALLEREKEKLRKLIGRFNGGLVSHAALSERLISQVKRGQTEQAELTAKVRALLSVGKEIAAAQTALQLKRVTLRLDEDREQLEAAEATFTNLLQTRDAAIAEVRANIEDVRRQIGDLKVKRAVADLESMASAMVSEIGAAGDSFNRLREMVGDERDKSAARARVAGARLNPGDFAQREAEQSALAALALDEFRADETRSAAPKLTALPDLSRVLNRDDLDV